MLKGKGSHFRIVAPFLALSLCWVLPADAAPDVPDPASGVLAPTVIFPKTSLGPDDLAVIVNDADPLSVEIAQYYKIRRGIPDENMIHVSFSPGSTTMSQAEFARIKAMVDAKTPQHVQAFALTWTKPYRVDCMSITTAFAAGFDKKFCATGCALTKPNPYFDSASVTPFKDLNLRPTISLAGSSFEEVKKLIDRGVQSDSTYPAGTGYLVDTSDKNRNVRAAGFEPLRRHLGRVVKLEQIKADYIEKKPDVLFYFTGMTQVDKLASNTFVPGAIADHLTSAGGQLTDSFQMSSLRWLEAGASGSYGAVVEPCNYPGKFPHPGVLVGHYTSGETLIEAYWKSVAMPGQGIFIGEPLANPYGGNLVSFSNGELTIRTHALAPGFYTVLGADSGIGPSHPVAKHVRVGFGLKEIKLKNAKNLFYRIVPERGGNAARL
ncbi:MAG: TIGR03790 family protein [Gammaproteobacteria bacterium]|nr:TIGR03790 family protein [Gammaproteobacteria bacterium]MBU1979848.1 TIGR03790 family protein [Gammaproteobacteria bacterium]